MYRKQVSRRRAVLVLSDRRGSGPAVDPLLSEGDGGPLHSIQRGVASVFAPLEEGASRALKPARDLVNWFDETFKARGENDDLDAEVQDLREQARRGAVGRGRERAAPQAARARTASGDARRLRRRSPRA